ncbi:MAG: hypothetical protein AAGD10_08205 [Myxococcota bacterium]
MRALLIGAGSLGRAVLRHLRDHELPVQLVGVLTAHHGRCLDGNGLDPTETLLRVETDDLDRGGLEDFEGALDAGQPEVILECIPQNIRSGEPALSMLRTALDQGIHAVTANKAPVALAYADLRARAEASGVQLRFEATVLDGMPLFMWVRSTPGFEPVRVRGILNVTSSNVLEAVQLGGTRARGLARAQARGVAEADSVLDLDGWDAAAKAALLANVWMGGSLRAVDVVRSGCDEVKDGRLREAAEAGEYYRLVATIEQGESGVLASVKPEALALGDPLYGLPGTRGGIVVEARDGRSFCLRQGRSGLEDAAAGMWMDVAAIQEGLPRI